MLADVAVIVPVMRRPQNAAPFMQSLLASVGGLACTAAVAVVCDADDGATAGAWKQAGAPVLSYGYAGRRPGTFAEKVNFGYRNTSETKWLFLVGDDVRFHPGWLDAAIRTAEHTGAAVVGTNDLANPRVMSGQHATHMLVTRAYVDGQGASWDGPGVVCHEGYRHWFVDDEIVTVAKQRGVWASAPNSIVEHLHPYFGKGQMDAVYQLGASHAEQDQALFIQRCSANRVTSDAS